MNRVALHTLGCKLNYAESSTIGWQFLQRGYRIVGIDEPAEVCLINTCSVTERADRECRKIVRRALRGSPQAYVIVVGCYAQLQPEEMAAIPGVDLVLGSKEKFNLFQFADGFRKTGAARCVVSPVDKLDTFDAASSLGFSDRTRAFLKIQDGCDYGCSFCTVPLARGGSRSAGATGILAQARAILGAGYKEIVLTGVNIGDYGSKTDSDLPGLLGQLTALEGLKRLRISSIEPNLLTDGLLEFWLNNPVMCKHFHIPLQAGSNEVLKLMRRRYTRDVYAERVCTIKAARPEAGIGADVIAGFPGETDVLFEEMYGFLVDLPVSYLHVFTYSERPGTLSAQMTNQIEPRVRHERSERLRILGERKRRAFYEGFAGKTAEVLFEGEREKGWMTGLSGEYVRVNVKTDRQLENQIRKVTIHHIDNGGCIGEIIDTSLDQRPRFRPKQCKEATCA